MRMSVEPMSDKPSLLFLCTGNSCRSQMAEGLARKVWGNRFSVHSAGIEQHGLNPLAVKAMREIDIDISAHRSKTLDDLGDTKLDYVVTVCGHANETCPAFPGPVKRLHAGFEDPPKLAANATSEEDAMRHYRRVRDDIAAFVRGLPEKLDA